MEGEGREWYPVKELNFNPRQMLWLIKNLPTLKEGRYPPDPIGSGYVDLHMGKRAIKHKAYFETPALIAAEVEARLALCGLDGLLLEATELWEISLERLAKCIGMSEWEIIKRKSNALRYISGFKRKRRTYRDYIGHRKNETLLSRQSH